MNDTSEYLYHYTNIETLALILQNHTFRLNSLDKMDDLQENETADLKNAGQFCYISSWTDDTTESIPMWKMYSSIESGVRICLRKQPFKLYDNSATEVSKLLSAPIKTDSSSSTLESLKSLIPLSDILTKGFITAGLYPSNFLHKVEYTSDPDKLCPKLATINNDSTNIAFGKLGKYKNMHWEFQHEWRYILLFLPININQDLGKTITDMQNIGNKIISGTATQPFPYYDLMLDDNAYSEMEITLSPKMSAGNRIIVESLVEKFNPTATIKESSLLGLI